MFNIFFRKHAAIRHLILDSKTELLKFSESSQRDDKACNSDLDKTSPIFFIDEEGRPTLQDGNEIGFIIK